MPPECQPEQQPLDEELELRESAVALEGDLPVLGSLTLTAQVPAPGTRSVRVQESLPHTLRFQEPSARVTPVEKRSLVETVAAMKDQVQELRKENEKIKRALEDLETLARNVLKNMKLAWDETDV